LMSRAPPSRIGCESWRLAGDEGRQPQSRKEQASTNLEARVFTRAPVNQNTE